MSKDKQALLDQIKADILDQNICPNLAQTATQLVMGDGNPDADVVFIGEAPGKREDEQGLPFVGAAGKFLDEMLDTAGMSRSDVFITNIVKYRPPENRDPLPDEKKAFLPFLDRQLSVIDPKVVVTLGRHSMNLFLPDMKISEVHGRAFRKKVAWAKTAVLETNARKKRVAEQGVPNSALRVNNAASDKAVAREDDQNAEFTSSFESSGTVVFMPLYHPAAALYNGSMRQTLIDDFAKIPQIIKKIN